MARLNANLLSLISGAVLNGTFEIQIESITPEEMGVIHQYWRRDMDWQRQLGVIAVLRARRISIIVRKLPNHPRNMQSNNFVGYIVRAGSGELVNGIHVPLQVTVGDVVLLPNIGGVQTLVNGEQLYTYSVDDIMYILS